MRNPTIKMARPAYAPPVAPSPLPGEDAGGSTDGAPRVRMLSMSVTRWPCEWCGDGEAKAILTVAEAAAMLGVSRKRMANMIAAEKGRLGRLPDFVCDAGGRMPRRILRHELVEWAKGKARKRGRPPKQDAQ